MTSRDSPCSSTVCLITVTSIYRNAITCINAEVFDNWKSFPVLAVFVHEYHLQSNRWQNTSWAISNPKRSCCESATLNMPAIWKTQQWPQNWKRSVFIPIPKKGNAKKCSNYRTIALISHASKTMLKILQVRLQQYMNSELPNIQAGFRKGRGTRDQIANIHWTIGKGREFQKHNYFCFIDYAKAFDCADHNKLENSSGDGNTRPPNLTLEKSKSICRSRSNS